MFRYFIWHIFNFRLVSCILSCKKYLWITETRGKKTSILPQKKWGILLKDGFSYEFPYISPGWKKWVPSIPRFWAEGKLLTPCLAFRNEGPYKARGQKYRCCAYGYIIWNPYIFTVTRCFFSFFLRSFESAWFLWMFFMNMSYCVVLFFN